MRRQKSLVWLDLCCGLKGASQPATDRGWKVISVDIDARFKPTIVADIRSLALKSFHVDVLWASTPCEGFTRCALPWKAKASWTPCGGCDEFYCNIHRKHVFECKCRPINEWVSNPYLPPTLPDLSIERAVKSAIAHYQPRFWIVENTVHARKFLTPLLGPVAANSHGHYCWGRLPGLLPNVNKPTKESMWPRKDRAAERAKIPYEIGEAICMAVERNS